MKTRRPPHRSWDPRLTPDPEKLQRAVEAHNAGDALTAAQLYVELDEAHPPHWHARMMGALLHYQRTSDPSEAIPLLRDVILALPRWPDPRYNLGVILEGLGQYEEARLRFEQTVAMEPAHSQAWTNLGNVRLALGDVPGALAAFDEALALNHGDDPMALYNLSHVYGLLGQWRDTWRLWEYRWCAPGHLRDHGLPKLIPPWDGTPTGHLIVTGEQGAGDTIQYLRFLPLLRARCRVLTLIVRHCALVPLIQHNFPGVHVIGIPADLPLQDQEQAVPDADAHLPLLSVVGRLGLSPHHVRRPSYLHAPRRPKPGGWRVGLCWAGSHTHKRDATRSIPFDVVSPLLDVPDVEWVNLTFNARGHVDDPRLASVEAECSDYLASASLYRTLDAVVTVDSSPLHLAGALGVPTLAMIGAAPDFRWTMHGETTPWYESVTLVRQPRAGDWASVVQDVRARLSAILPYDPLPMEARA